MLLFHPEYPQALESSLFRVIPVCYEKTTSFNRGTYAGPKAILEASKQLTVYTEHFLDSLPDTAIHTRPLINRNLDDIYDEVYETPLGTIPIIIGGEHTITVPIIDAMNNRETDDFGIVVIDAHLDLFDTYEDNKYSHACTFRRVLELKDVPIHYIGTRAVNPIEYEFAQKHNISVGNSNSFESSIPDDFPSNIYLSIDVDGFDPSVIPGTGTPVPGGISWRQGMSILEAMSKEKTIVGVDIVELMPNDHYSAFTVAQLIYNLMTFIYQANNDSIS